MEKKTWYVADDGRKFDNETDCEAYEAKINHKESRKQEIMDMGKKLDKMREEYWKDYGERIYFPFNDIAWFRW